jgi:hypothetical protein
VMPVNFADFFSPFILAVAKNTSRNIKNTSSKIFFCTSDKLILRYVLEPLYVFI